jgi:hypothetical protein
VTTGNVDDYFTADEDEEEETEKKKEESENNPDRTFEGDELEDEEELSPVPFIVVFMLTFR